MPQRTRPRKGFTLVEILIVVVILGILAAIVIPQFSNASDTARVNNTLAILQTLRTQLELYKVHHGAYPTLDQMWTNMLETTDAEGNVDPTGKFGPYLQKAPVNIYTTSSNIVATGQGTAADGFEYDAATGHIRAVGFDEITTTFAWP